MIFPLFRRNRRPDTISALYGTIVAQARRPVFYSDYAVADTVNGRFDLLLLHASLVVDRLMREDAGKEAGQALFDLFCADIDDNLREMGVGDLSVPKHMKRAGEAFYGRAQAYRQALAAPDDAALIDAVTRNVYAGEPQDAAARLAAYIRRMADELERQSCEAIAAGRLSFPDPSELLSERISMSGNKALKDKKEVPVWTALVELGEVPEAGFHLELEANDTARSAIAKLAGVIGISKLHASFDVVRRGSGLHVTGRVTAEVAQTCVVTLEPLTNPIEEDVDLLFLPGAPERLAAGNPDEDEDVPEPLVGGRVDLGVIATEYLVLAIDPYPRKEGVTFEAPKVGDDAPHPFAALAALKKDPSARS
jgi:cytochrome b pre-mRNA-processing protein 3